MNFTLAELVILFPKVLYQLNNPYHPIIRNLTFKVDKGVRSLQCV